MKKIKILGIICVILAIAVAAVGVVTNNAKDGEGAFASALNEARASVAAVASNEKAVKNAAANEKKVSNAPDKFAAAKETTAQLVADAKALDEALAAGNASGDVDVDELFAALNKLASGWEGLEEIRPLLSDEVNAAIGQMDAGIDAVYVLTERKVLELYQACVADAYKAVSDVEGQVTSVHEGMLKVYGLVGVDATAEGLAPIVEPVCNTIEECHGALTMLADYAVELESWLPTMTEWAQSSTAAAAEASSHKVSLAERGVILLADNYIGVMFTAALLLAAAIVMLFFAKGFANQWKKNPVFSVFMALVVMLVLQTYALGFSQATFGEWAKFWFDNTFNVLRANTSVGMIALGMTLVIITGGIDLAVGSTVAGVGTVLMSMIDTGEHGILVKFGITGVPAFIIGIAVALVVGVGIGAIIGALVTKGKIPPFIVTLGVMNIVRSVSQYFTKSYTPTVPKEFEAIANTVIFGQRPMTIIYWVILAIIFYLVMKNTAFGRYVYAVGSNERTSRLSGINTDKVKMKVYMISGLVVSIAAVAQLSRLGGMDVASAGNGYEMDAIAAVVVGGTSMAGGRGSIMGTVLGVLIIGLMNNLLILLGVDSFLTDAFKGLIVVAAVFMQRKENN